MEGSDRNPELGVFEGSVPSKKVAVISNDGQKGDSIPPSSLFRQVGPPSSPGVAWLTLFCDFLSGHLHGDDVLPAEAPPMNQDRPGLGSGSHHTSGLCPRLARAQLRRMALAVQSGGNVEEMRSVHLALISL